MYRKRRNKNREEQGKSKRLADIDFSYWAGNKVDSERCNKCRYLDSHSSCRLLDISTGVQVWRNFLIKGHVPRLKRHSSVPVNEQLLMRLAWRTENKTVVAHGRTISCNNSFFHASNRDKGAENTLDGWTTVERHRENE